MKIKAINTYYNSLNKKKCLYKSLKTNLKFINLKVKIKTIEQILK